MPELPEVETTLRGIEPHILNKEITSVNIRQPSLRWSVPTSLIQKKLVKNTFSGITRRGKYLLLQSSQESLIIHLGMSGSLRISKEEDLKKHDHIDICFSDGMILRYCDPRRFGCFLWTENPDTHFLLKDLGPEPLGNHFNGEHLFTLSRKRKMPIKNFIMNSKIVVGVGNIYASEILFMSKINPFKKVKLLSKKECQKIITNSRKILLKAISKGGSSIRDFKDTSGLKGGFQNEFKVYQQEGVQCKSIGCSDFIKKKIISNRSTFFCDSCQK